MVLWFCIARLSPLHVKERWFTRRSMMMMIHMPAHSPPSSWPPFRKMQPFPVFVTASHSACGSQIGHYEGEISRPRPTNERLDSPSVSTSAWRISERETIPLTTSCSSTTTSLCTWETKGRCNSPWPHGHTTVLSTTSGAHKHLSNSPF